jgi:hypothetical protein
VLMHLLCTQEVTSSSLELVLPGNSPLKEAMTTSSILLSSSQYIEGKGKGKAVPVLNYAPRHEDVLGEWRYSSMHS